MTPDQRMEGVSTAHAGPLHGVRVVDLTSSFAAPTASMYLADMGSDVVKIEPPLGDDSRQWGPPFIGDDAAWFLSANRGKQSVALDIRSPLAMQAIHRLLEDADVVLLNVVPSKLAGLGLDPTELLNRYPRLVVCVVSGHGMTGPDAALPGYDLIAQARSGMMSLTGPAGGIPQRVSAPVSDVAAGTVAAFAIAAALVRQRSEGRGEIIDVALLEADLAFVRPRISSFAAGDDEPRPSGGSDSVIAIYQAFETMDAPIVLAIGNDRHWERARIALELPDWTGAEDLETNAGRRKRRAEVVGAVADALSVKSREEALAILKKASIPAAPIHYLSDVVNDPHLRARGSIIKRTTESGADYIDVAPPWRLASDSPDAQFKAPPARGQHTREVLEKAGLSTEFIDQLVAEGVAWAK